jgi:hypothetical protein
MRFAVFTLLPVVLSLVGCKSTTIIDEHRDAETSLNAGDTVVVLGRRHNSEHETEKDFISCVGKSLAGGDKAIKVIPEDQFVDSMYPYFEVSTAPMDVKNLDELVKIPEIARKFSEFKIRYFIWIDGHTEKTDSSGSISCSIGPGGGGCFGFATWDDEADYEASVWDFENLNLAGRISAETKGTSYLPAVFIPIPLLARVQANACSSMATQLKSFLR